MFVDILASQADGFNAPLSGEGGVRCEAQEISAIASQLMEEEEEVISPWHVCPAWIGAGPCR